MTDKGRKICLAMFGSVIIFAIALAVFMSSSGKDGVDVDEIEKSLKRGGQYTEIKMAGHRFILDTKEKQLCFFMADVWYSGVHGIDLVWVSEWIKIGEIETSQFAYILRGGEPLIVPIPNAKTPVTEQEIIKCYFEKERLMKAKWSSSIWSELR